MDLEEQQNILASLFVSEKYRNNKTLRLSYLGTEYMVGDSYTSMEKVLVPTVINFAQSPETY